MKNKSFIYAAKLLLLLIFVFSCQKEEPIPTITPTNFSNTSASNPSFTSLKVSTNFSGENSSINSYGFVYSSTVSGSSLELGQENVSSKNFTTTLTGNSFNATLTNLSPGSIYYIRSYIVNASTTFYSDKIDGTTLAQTLIEATEILSINANDIRSQAIGISTLLGGFPFKDTKVYKIKYRTTNVDNTPIEASGVLVVPQGNSTFPLVSYQHGTITDKSNAPSVLLTSNNSISGENSLITIAASIGMVIIMPDYIGYGSSSNLPHPYEHGNSLGKASYDMLIASKEYMNESLDVNLNNNFYITGYSEGGYAGMALHRHIEDNSNLVITRSLLGAGAYNKTAFSKEIMMKNENLTFIRSYLWVLDTYNRVYNLNHPWNYYVNEPYATTLESITNLDSSFDINLIASNPQILFKTNIRNAIINRDSETAILNAITDNDLFDWRPQYPIRLYHGTSDDFVYPSNSITTANAMKAKGAPVEYIPLQGDHATAIIPYFTNTLLFIINNN